MTIVDRRYSVAEGQAVKSPCRAATTGNITLSGLQTIDGVALAEGDRVLVRGQSSGTENGIYSASTGNWTRTRDFDGSYDVVSGTRVLVVEGTSYGAHEFYVSTTGSITVDSTSLAFTVIATGSGVVPTFADGTTSAPGIRFTDDSDTGIRRSVSGTIDFVSNQTDVLEVGPNGAIALNKFTLKDSGSGNTIFQLDTSNSGIPDLVFDTRAHAAAANIPAATLRLRILGYTTSFDGGGGAYTRISTPSPSYTYHLQTADGGWWVLDTPYVNQKQCGGKVDGSTDDTTAVTDCLRYASTYGVWARFYAGTSMITNVTAPATGLKLDGTGCTLKQSSSTGTALTILGSTRICGLTIDGNYTDETVASGYSASHYGIRTYGSVGTPNSDILIEDCEVKNFGDSGMELRIIQRVKVLRCYVHRCGYGGIMCWSATDCMVADNVIDNIFPGSTAGGASQPFANAYGATFSYYSGEGYSSFCTFARNHVSNVPTWEGLDEHSGSYITFTGNYIQDCSQGIACQHSVAGQELKRVVITGNTIKNFASTTTKGGQTCYLAGGINIVAGPSGSQGQGLVISGNYIESSGDTRTGGAAGNAGAIFVTNVRNFTITGNSIFLPYKYGIMLEGTSTNIRNLYGMISGNLIDAPVSVGGTQVHFLASTHTLAHVVGNMSQGTGTGFDQSGSPTYTTTFASNSEV